jgi:hypothetical protein
VEEYSIRQPVLYEKNLGWMAFSELNSEELGWLWLMASVTWREGETLAEGIHDWGK